MPPVLRSFTVFQDTSSVEEPSAHRQTKSTLPLKRVTRSALSKSENSVPLDSTSITVPDKENLHPVTGERAGLSAAEKKRKDGFHILATKLHNPPSHPASTKKHKKELSVVLKDEGSPNKKRKASAPAINSAVPKGTAKPLTKDTKVTSKPRKSASTKRVTTRTRAISTLPKVAEEEVAAAAAGQTEEPQQKVKSKKAVTKDAPPQLSQAGIDSRCYELTVQPLADVSQAYEDTSATKDTDAQAEKAKFQTVKEPSVEPQIRDYCAPPIAISTNLQLGSSCKSPFEEPTGSTKAFSTPERKAIYAAFTFSSPSPSGDRFSQTIRASGIPRLELA